MRSNETGNALRIFISHSGEDASAARTIARALKDADLSVWLDQWDLAPGDDLERMIKSAITGSDVAIILLSPAALESDWVNAEIEMVLAEELQRRGMEVVIALLSPSDLPDVLRSRQVVDLSGPNLTHQLERLVDRIRRTEMVDFAALTPARFEELVGDLLEALGFRIEMHRSVDYGFDFRAVIDRLDPFGLPEIETWLVEVKAYGMQRVSVNSIRQLVGVVASETSPTRGLLVTSGRLTSVAREYLQELSIRSGVRVRVIDGAELKRLVSSQPRLIGKYFGQSGEEARDPKADS
jgi:HJR/Mrr/RecB family endonuclease